MTENEGTFPWFRFWNEAANDDKIDMIADELKMDYTTVLGAWSIIMTLASVSPIRGFLFVTEEIGHTPISIAKKMKISVKNTEKLLIIFEKFGLIEKDFENIFHVTNWEKRQPKSDNVNIRVRKFRKEHALNEEGNESETLQKRFCNTPELETELDLDLNTIPVNEKVDDHSFVGEFLKVSGIPGLNNDYQGTKLIKLRKKYGDDKIIRFAEWARDKEILTMDKALSSMETALPNWTDAKPAKKHNHKSSSKTVAEVIPQQTKEEVHTLAQQMLEYRKAEKIKEAWKLENAEVDA